MRINLVSSKDVPNGARSLPPAAIGGFMDAAVMVNAKQPLFAVVTNSNDDTLVCTLEADIKDKDEDNEWSVQLRSGASSYVQFGTSTSPSSNGTYEWKVDASTSGWNEVSIQFMIL